MLLSFFMTGADIITHDCSAASNASLPFQSVLMPAAAIAAFAHSNVSSSFVSARLLSLLGFSFRSIVSASSSFRRRRILYSASRSSNFFLSYILSFHDLFPVVAAGNVQHHANIFDLAEVDLFAVFQVDQNLCAGNTPVGVLPARRFTLCPCFMVSQAVVQFILFPPRAGIARLSISVRHFRILTGPVVDGLVCCCRNADGILRVQQFFAMPEHIVFCNRVQVVNANA